MRQKGMGDLSRLSFFLIVPRLYFYKENIVTRRFLTFLYLSLPAEADKKYFPAEISLRGKVKKTFTIHKEFYVPAC